MGKMICIINFLTVQEHKSKDKYWLVDKGYFVLSESDAPYPTNKVDAFIKEFEKT